MKSDNELQVFEDAVVHVPKPKLCKLNEPQQIPWGIKCINAEKAWKKTTGKNVKVAVIDSGIEHHKDLYKNIKGEFNAIDPEIPAIDEQGHGTHVAGIIAAENNHTGIVGVAPNVSLYAVKVLDAYGLGYLSDVTEAIEWCINNEIDIINLSFDTKQDMPILRDSITRAIDAGIIVVSVAGNTYGGNTTYPATYDGVISVSAFDKNFNVAEFSATGKIDFCAPGVEILSTYLNNDSFNVVAINDENSNEVAKYEYDKSGIVSAILGKDSNDNWVDMSGNSSFIGTINLIRLHSYYYDNETKWYYTGYKYYDSTKNKFVGGTDNLNLISTYEDFSKNTVSLAVTQEIAQRIATWQTALLNDSNFGKPINTYTSGWYNNLSDAEILSRLIYGENTTNTADQARVKLL